MLYIALALFGLNLLVLGKLADVTSELALLRYAISDVDADVAELENDVDTLLHAAETTTTPEA